MHKLNVIISRTDTLVGKAIRGICNTDLNHTSIAFDNDYSTVYSFTRKYKPFFFTGCFCKEPIGRLSSVVVTEIDITDEEYEEIMNFIKELEKHFRIYNYLELATIMLHIKMPLKHNYTCSTFAATVLENTSIELDKSPRLYKPHELRDLLATNITYEGNIENLISA